eukprot:1141380-Pelagomonas_calceolata.AAC.10
MEESMSFSISWRRSGSRSTEDGRSEELQRLEELSDGVQRLEEVNDRVQRQEEMGDKVQRLKERQRDGSHFLCDGETMPAHMC